VWRGGFNTKGGWGGNEKRKNQNGERGWQKRNWDSSWRVPGIPQAMGRKLTGWEGAPAGKLRQRFTPPSGTQVESPVLSHAIPYAQAEPAGSCTSVCRGGTGECRTRSDSPNVSEKARNKRHVLQKFPCQSQRSGSKKRPHPDGISFQKGYPYPPKKLGPGTRFGHGMKSCLKKKPFNVNSGTFKK